MFVCASQRKRTSQEHTPQRERERRSEKNVRCHLLPLQMCTWLAMQWLRWSLLFVALSSVARRYLRWRATTSTATAAVAAQATNKPNHQKGKGTLEQDEGSIIMPQRLKCIRKSVSVKPHVRKGLTSCDADKHKILETEVGWRSERWSGWSAGAPAQMVVCESGSSPPAKPTDTPATTHTAVATR